MKKTIFQVLAILILAVSISAQENQPQLLVEFGETPLSFIKAYVEGVAYDLDKPPNHKVLARIYGGRKYSFASAYVRGSMIKAFWENYTKRPAEKLVIQFCNVNEEPIRTEFFAIRENDKVESCDENLTPQKKLFCFIPHILILLILKFPKSLSIRLKNTILALKVLPANIRNSLKTF